MIYLEKIVGTGQILGDRKGFTSPGGQQHDEGNTKPPAILSRFFVVFDFRSCVALATMVTRIGFFGRKAE